jgi:hypothetical protein
MRKEHKQLYETTNGKLASFSKRKNNSNN